MSCRDMGRSPGSLPLRPAVRAAGSHRSNVSMTIMRPPQQGHAGRKSSGSSRSRSSGDEATSRSSRARARLVLRVEQASRP